ncbi:MAG: glycyl-radical enzyme activating protein [Anaerolineae bacterium]|nr:glycyl-radical enzyme activating protein [Anaerolineae bacterium]
MSLTDLQTPRLQQVLFSEGVIFDIRKFSIQDGPGIRTTVFFKGCPLSCWWCHNPESQSPQIGRMDRSARCQHCGACVQACPQQAIHLGQTGPVTEADLCTLCGLCTTVCYSEAREMTGQVMNLAEVMAQIRADIPFYDESKGGVTFSGGEPLMQPDFLLALLQACRREEIHTALDTSGYAAWPVLERVLPYVNLVLYDLKTMDEKTHRHYTGVSNRLILENLQKISSTGKNIIIRMPIVPGINDKPEQLEAAGQFMADLPTLDHVDLLAYHSSATTKYEGLGLSYRLPEVVSPSPETMTAIAARLRAYGLTVHIGG